MFVERFADQGNRVADITGAYLLVLAGLAFAWFAHGSSGQTRASRADPPLGAAAAGGIVLAAVAWATPMSLWFGSLVDDPGLQDGQAVLPQFGYVAFTMGAMLHAQLVDAFSGEPVAGGIAAFAFQCPGRVGEGDLHRSAELASRLPAGRGPGQPEPCWRQRSALEKGS